MTLCHFLFVSVIRRNKEGTEGSQKVQEPDLLQTLQVNTKLPDPPLSCFFFVGFSANHYEFPGFPQSLAECFAHVPFKMHGDELPVPPSVVFTVMQQEKSCGTGIAPLPFKSCFVIFHACSSLLTASHVCFVTVFHLSWKNMIRFSDFWMHSCWHRQSLVSTYTVWNENQLADTWNSL